MLVTESFDDHIVIYFLRDDFFLFGLNGFDYVRIELLFKTQVPNICGGRAAIIGSHQLLISGDGFPFKNNTINGNHNLFEFRIAKANFYDQYFSASNFLMIIPRM